MKEYKTSQLRNLAIAAHGGAGKTSLAEAMLFDSSELTRLGRTTDGNTCLDFDPDEIKRQITISTSIGHCEWAKHKINILDTPGYANFIADTKASLRVADAALVIVSAISGIKVQTEKIWNWASQQELPRLIFINKLDRERASFERALGDIHKGLGITPLPLQIPIGSEQNLQGVIDLLQMQAYFYKKDGSGKFEKKNIPDQLQEEADRYHLKLVEAIAETDDELLAKYFDDEPLSSEQLQSALREATVTCRLVPILCGSALLNIGVQPLLDAIINYLPSPQQRPEAEGLSPDKQPRTRGSRDSDPFSALIFKTLVDQHIGKLSIFRVYSGVLECDSSAYNPNRGKKERIGHLVSLQGKSQKAINRVKAGDIAAAVKLKDSETGDTLCSEKAPIQFPPIEFPEPVISYAITPRRKGDEDKVSMALHRLMEEDPSIKLSRDDDTQEILVSGMGQVHIEVIVERLKRKFGVEVDMHLPHVPYRETIRGSAKAQGKYKKQTGGRGQYGDTWLEVTPLPRGTGFKFVDKIVGGAIPRQYIPAVEKGVIEALQGGILAGYPVVDVQVTLYDGSFHSVDSSEMAFKIAGSLGIKKAVSAAQPVLLEPVMDVEITVPEDCMGEIIGDLNSRRGKVAGVEPRANSQNIHAQVPMAEMLHYAPELRSMTGGRGVFSMKFSHYEELPFTLSEKIIARAQAEKEHEKK